MLPMKRPTPRLRLLPGALLTALVLCLVAPAASSASFHLVQVREVFPGTMLNPDSAYVELQMYAGGQNLVGGRSLTTYNPDGSLRHTFPIPENVPDGGTQRTILIGDEFPPGASEDFFDADLGTNIVRAGGAVCFDSVDCVAWGSYTGGETLPSPVGAPAAAAGGIPDETALVRSISRGCPTLLEAGDDTNVSAQDFALEPPAPRSNATAPTEVSCGAPQTVIDRGPRKQTKKRTAKFKFSSPDPGATFECAFDEKPFKACTSPLKLKRIKPGKHVFSVRAVVGGTPDPSPATYQFKRKKKK